MAAPALDDFALRVPRGRYDDALRHLTEMRELAEYLDNPWLGAVSRVYLGTVAVAQGRLTEAVAAVRDLRGAGTAAP